MTGKASCAACFALTLSGIGCSESLDVRYSYDAFEMVDNATALSGGSVVAVGQRATIKPVGGPNTADIEVEETHFVRGTQTVAYRGQLVFRCRTNEVWCERTGDIVRSGTRARDVFIRWPNATTQR